MKHGMGRYQWGDGTYYEGEWRLGYQHGIGLFGVPWLKAEGTVSSSSSKERVGIWRNGRRAFWLDPSTEGDFARIDTEPRRVQLNRAAAGEKLGFMYSTPKDGQTVLFISRILEGGLLD